MSVDLPVMRFFEHQLCAGHWLQKGGESWGEIVQSLALSQEVRRREVPQAQKRADGKAQRPDCRAVLGTSFYKVAVKKIRWQVGTCNVPALGIGIASEGQKS